MQDADDDVYQLDAGSLPADGRDHTLTVTLADQAPGASAAAGPATGAAGSAGAAGAASAVYPLRLTAVSLGYTLPARPARGPAMFTVDGFSAGPGTAPRSRRGAARLDGGRVV